MKSIKFIFVGLLIFAANNIFAVKKVNVNDTVVNFRVLMDCQSCKSKIEKNIAFEKGVKLLEVNMNDQLVIIKYNKLRNTPELLKQAIEKLHYKVEVLELSK